MKKRITAVILVIICLFLTSCTNNNTDNNNNSDSSITREEIFKTAVLSTAQVIVGGEEYGTGFIAKVDGDDIYVLSCNHTFERVGGGYYETATLIFSDENGFPQSEHEAVLTLYDKEHDLALLKFTKSSGDNFAALDFMSQKSVTAGESLYSIGNVGGEGLAMYDGIASKSFVAISSNNTVAFQMTTPINAGHSGGPILNKDGKVAGIGFAKLIRAGSGNDDEQYLVDGISYAIPSAITQKFLEAAIVTLGEGGIQIPMQINKLIISIKDYPFSISGIVYDFNLLQFTATHKSGELTVTKNIASQNVAAGNRGVNEKDKIIKFGELEIASADIFDLFVECYNYKAGGEGTQLELKIERENGTTDYINFTNFTKRM